MLIDPKLGTWFFLGEILTTLENKSMDPHGKPVLAGGAKEAPVTQLDLFREQYGNEAIDMLRNANVDELTPLQALNLIGEIKKKLRG